MVNSIQEDLNSIGKAIYATGDSGVNVDYVYAEGGFEITALNVTLDNSERFKSFPGKVAFSIRLDPYEAINANVMIVWTDCLGTVDESLRPTALNSIARLWGWTNQYGVKACLTPANELYFGGHDVVPEAGTLDDYSRRFWGLCLILDQCWPEIRNWIARG